MLKVAEAWSWSEVVDRLTILQFSRKSLCWFVPSLQSFSDDLRPLSNSLACQTHRMGRSEVKRESRGSESGCFRKLGEPSTGKDLRLHFILTTLLASAFSRRLMNFLIMWEQMKLKLEVFDVS